MSEEGECVWVFAENFIGKYNKRPGRKKRPRKKISHKSGKTFSFSLALNLEGKFQTICVEKNLFEFVR
jgi:hypothetical protein